MHKLKRSIGAFTLLCFATLVSCESDPDIMCNEAPNPLFIWGFADKHTGKHQIRIRESIQEEGNMFDLAKDYEMTVPDDPLQVQLIIPGSNDTAVILNPVVYPKEEGIFSSKQNIVYELDHEIPEDADCYIYVKRLATGEIITSSVEWAKAQKFTYPKKNSWYEPKYSFTIGEKPFHVAFEVSPYMVQKLVMEIKYVDFTTSGDTVCQKAIFEGQPVYGGDGYKSYSRSLPLDYLFNIFNRTIPDDPGVKFRWFYRFNFKNLAASSGLRNYLKFGEKFIDNRKLEFTNIEGGFGVFWVCDETETGDIEPTPSFPDTLARSPEMEGLKFTRYMFPGTYKDPDDEK